MEAKLVRYSRYRPYKEKENTNQKRKKKTLTHMENGGKIFLKKLLFQSHSAQPFVAKIGDKKGKVFEALRSSVGCDQGLKGGGQLACH